MPYGTMNNTFNIEIIPNHLASPMYSKKTFWNYNIQSIMFFSWASKISLVQSAKKADHLVLKHTVFFQIAIWFSRANYNVLHFIRIALL